LLAIAAVATVLSRLAPPSNKPLLFKLLSRELLAYTASFCASSSDLRRARLATQVRGTRSQSCTRVRVNAETDSARS
jgi:hypothetical protein